MNADLGLGKLIQGEAYRDAIHVAVAPVIAATALKPGLAVGLDEQGRAASNVGKHLGIVDPFLRIAEVKEGGPLLAVPIPKHGRRDAARVVSSIVSNQLARRRYRRRI